MARTARTPRYSCLLLLAAALLMMVLGPRDAYAQLRIVNYNTANGTSGISSPRPGMQTVLDAIGQEVVQGNARPLDVLILQEQFGPTSTSSQIAALLNNSAAGSPYTYANLAPDTTGAGRVGVVYNSNTVQLISATAIGSTSSSGAARQPARYQFRPVGYTSAADFYIYNSHYKASDTSADADRRNVEATFIRADADALGQGASILYAGDFNLYRNTEAAYQTLTAAGNGQAIDPLGNNFTSPVVHSQSPFNPATAGNNSLIGGGIDNRFDFQLSTAEVQNGEGFDLIANTYHTFANNGSTLNNPVNVGNTAPLPGVANRAAVLDALATVTDHLPVVADYQLPAKLAGSATLAQNRLIVGSSTTTSVTVYNDAPVAAANAADELDYQVTGSAAAAGAFSGIDPAAGAHATGSLTFAAGNTPGSVSGTVHFSTTSPQAPVTSFTQNLNADVLAHSSASFSPLTIDGHLDLDFGAVQQHAADPTLSVLLANLTSPTYAAALDIDAIFAVGGPVNPFTWSLTQGGQIAPGGLALTNVSLDTDALGLFSTTFTVLTSDEDLPGAAVGRTLTLTVTAQIIPEPATLLLALAAAPLLLRRRRASHR